MAKGTFAVKQKVKVKKPNGSVLDAVYVQDLPTMKGLRILVKYTDGSEGRPHASMVAAA